MTEVIEHQGVRRKALRPDLWKALLTLAPPLDLAVILIMALRRGKPSFRSPRVVHPRPLGGRPITLRPRTSDARVMLDVFVGRFHLPPAEVVEPRVIWDLGANIGLTVAHFAALYPTARVVGVEPDPETAEAARRNIAPWADRCSIVTGAAWSSDGELSFAQEPGEEFGAHVIDPLEMGGTALTVQGYSLDTLLADDDRVDYLKVDIEGAEHEILSNRTGWAARVGCVSVEIHPPHTVRSITADLESLGYEVQVNTRHWASVIATRPGA